MNWQPIETAPKDETVILAWRYYPCAIRWNSEDPKWSWQAVCLGAMSAPFEENGFMEGDQALTHWAPLPDGPQS